MYFISPCKVAVRLKHYKIFMNVFNGKALQEWWKMLYTNIYQTAQNSVINILNNNSNAFTLIEKNGIRHDNLIKTQLSIDNALKKNTIIGTSSEFSASYKDKTNGFSVRIIQLNTVGNHFKFYDAKGLKIADVDVFSNGQIKITNLFGSRTLKGYLNFDNGLKGARIFLDDTSFPLSLFR